MDEISKGTLVIPFEISKVLTYLLALSIPWSVEWSFGKFNINAISEFVLVASFISLIIQVEFWNFLKKEILQNWISRVLALFWLIMAISILFSAFPLVSLKYVIISGLSIMVFFFGLCYLASKENIIFKRVILIYLFSFIPLIIYSWIHHYQYDFRMDVSVMVSRPFIKNHAIYSACVLMLFFMTLSFEFLPGRAKMNRLWKGLILFFFLVALYFSFSRAAWMVFIAVMVFYGLVHLIKLSLGKWLTLIVGVILLVGISTIWMLNAGMGNESISKSGLPQEHLRSSLNVKTDVSNLERINRYKCALRMIGDRPIFGFGVGTFQFAYLDYQREEDMTRLSVIKPDNDGLPHHSGRGGEAHSEYFGNLAEMGLIGFLMWMLLVIFSMYSGLKTVISRKFENRNHHLPLSFLGVITCFYMLSLVNDFWQVEEVLFLFMCGLAGVNKEAV